MAVTITSASSMNSLPSTGISRSAPCGAPASMVTFWHAQLNVWDDKGSLYTVDVVVVRDAKELTELLKSEFPEAKLRVRLLAKGIYLSGYVPRPELVEQVVSLAGSFYPQDKIVNGIVVGGVRQVACT